MYACAPFLLRVYVCRVHIPLWHLFSVVVMVSPRCMPHLCVYTGPSDKFTVVHATNMNAMLHYTDFSPARALCNLAPWPGKPKRNESNAGAKKSATTPCLPASPPRVHNHRHSTRSSRLINIRTIRIRSFFICKLFGDK